MALAFLFRRNAELCISMAGAAKSIELRERWIELAAHWQQKAEVENPLTPSTHDPTPALLIPDDLKRSGDLEPEVTEAGAPALVPLEDPMLNAEKPSDTPALTEEIADDFGLDDFWRQTIADIRPQQRR